MAYIDTMCFGLKGGVMSVVMGMKGTGDLR